MEGFSPTEQPQLSWLDRQQAEPEPRKLQLQQVSLETLGKEHEQLRVASEYEEVEPMPPSNPRMCKAEKRQLQRWLAKETRKEPTLSSVKSRTNNAYLILP